ncbi:MAG: hypothetical protein RL338_602, partial [Chloroflexota bacterium]
MTTVRARSRRAISLLITTGLLTGLVFASAPVAEAGRGGCKVTNGTASYAGLARAIKLAAAGSTLTIANTCVGRFTIGKDLTLVGTDQSSTLDGNGGGTVLTIQTGATVTIRQLRITNGFANRGGGVYNLGTVSMTDGAQVVANSAGTAGGGIHNEGTLTLSGSAKVSGNLAPYGAGISNRNG